MIESSPAVNLQIIYEALSNLDDRIKLIETGETINIHDALPGDFLMVENGTVWYKIVEIGNIFKCEMVSIDSNLTQHIIKNSTIIKITRIKN